MADVLEVSTLFKKQIDYLQQTAGGSTIFSNRNGQGGARTTKGSAVAFTLFKLADTNKSGFLEFVEFETLVRKTLKLTEEQLPKLKLRSLWRNMDADGNGIVIFKEFSDFLKGQLQVVGPGVPRPPENPKPSDDPSPREPQFVKRDPNKIRLGINVSMHDRMHERMPHQISLGGGDKILLSFEPLDCLTPSRAQSALDRQERWRAQRRQAAEAAQPAAQQTPQPNGAWQTPNPAGFGATGRSFGPGQTPQQESVAAPNQMSAAGAPAASQPLMATRQHYNPSNSYNSMGGGPTGGQTGGPMGGPMTTPNRPAGFGAATAPSTGQSYAPGTNASNFPPRISAEDVAYDRTHFPPRISAASAAAVEREMITALRSAMVANLPKVIECYRRFDIAGSGQVTQPDFRQALPLLKLSALDFSDLDLLFDELEKSARPNTYARMRSLDYTQLGDMLAPDYAARAEEQRKQLARQRKDSAEGEEVFR